MMKIINVGSRVMNTYLYRIDDGFVMIDTGYDTGYSNFARKISKCNIDLESIKYVFLTHAHDDHAGFLNELLSKNQTVKVIMSNKSLPVLATGQNSFNGGCSSLLALTFCELMKLFGKGEHRFPPIENCYHDRLIVVTEGNRQAIEKALHGRIFDTAGHTSDSISLMHENGAFFCGDAAMNGIPSMHRITIWIENKKDYRRAWKQMIALKPMIIYPAHGASFGWNDLNKNMKRLSKIKLLHLK